MANKKKDEIVPIWKSKNTLLFYGDTLTELGAMLQLHIEMYKVSPALLLIKPELRDMFANTNMDGTFIYWQTYRGIPIDVMPAL